MNFEREELTCIEPAAQVVTAAAPRITVNLGDPGWQGELRGLVVWRTVGAASVNFTPHVYEAQGTDSQDDVYAGANTGAGLVFSERDLHRVMRADADGNVYVHVGPSADGDTWRCKAFVLRKR